MKTITPIFSLPIEDLISLENTLAKYAGPDRVISSEEMRKEIAAMPQANYSFSTGLSRLDDAIGRIESGELIAIGGPTKNGKTLLAQTITAHLSETKNYCTWFSFEVPMRQFLKQVEETTNFYLPRDLKQADMFWLRNRIIESKLKFNTRVVFIDNLHHLVDFSVQQNLSVDIGVVIRFLKRIAVELNTAIIIICHSRKPDFSNQRIMPEVSEWDLRDSSFIPQESDCTIMVQRKNKVDEKDKPLKEFSEQALIKVCLHRRTGTMGRKIHVRKIGNRLEEDAEYYSRFT